MQAYVGLPIAATFLTGILWNRPMPRAAITTLLMVVVSTGSAVKQGGEATVAILVAVGGLWVHFS